MTNYEQYEPQQAEQQRYYPRSEQQQTFYQSAEQQQIPYQPGYQPVQPVVRVEVSSYSRQYTPAPAAFISAGALAAALSYVGGWLTGLLLLLFGGQNRFVRFHALQSVLFFGAINLFDIGFVSFIGRWHHFLFPALSGYLVLPFIVINIICCVGWLVAIIQAARGVYFKLPLVGDIAERFIGQNVVLK
ncbi:MAG: hypothetical protein M3Z08_01835 [Chloroflexota bacterium]|nr:hypothetical protein [Chloroflexota bacterium]